jgi:sigma-B regulation protein RsbU (phosphoserine phosphatase)
MSTAFSLPEPFPTFSTELKIDSQARWPNITVRENHDAHYQHLQQEIAFAVGVQKHLLQVPVPHRPNLDIAGVCQPCCELGGDFYDFIDLDESIVVALADVSGKGFGASILMASLRASLRAHLADLDDLQQVVRRVNRDLVRDTRSHEFATLFLGAFDPRTSCMTYCSAGHEPAMLVHDGACRILDAGGMALGIDDRQLYDTEVVSLVPGDLLAVFSDGVSEAHDAREQPFGRERIQHALVRNTHQSARRICDSLLMSVKWFLGDAPRTDDTTIAVVRAV